ncbi:MAG TPA: DUF3995 domain-containing protein [Candidatus Saccharimonadales bacterium]
MQHTVHQRLLVLKWSALGATLLAFSYAAVSAYWALGGMAGLRSVGAVSVRLADTHSIMAKAIIWSVVLMKFGCGIASFMLIKKRWPKVIKVFNGIVGTILSLYGGVLVLVEALVETGILHTHGAVDWYALKWHLVVWDMWFLAWGALLLLAVREFDSV